MLFLFDRSSKSKKLKEEEEEAEVKSESSAPKRVPLSLEELLAKKKAEEEALSKVSRDYYITSIASFFPAVHCFCYSLYVIIIITSEN